MIRAGVVGASGYVGSELVRWLLGHPAFTLAGVATTSRPGQRLGDVVPALYGLTDLVLEPVEAMDVDVVFLATPHGAARPLVPSLRARVVVDTSSDHRGEDGWVYGPPELVDFAGAERIAAPGCFATAIELAVAPFVTAGVITGPVCVAATTGSTGSGATPSAATHHPERFANVRAYKVLEHQHVPEVLRLLGRLGRAPSLLLVPTSAPLDRGIFASCFVPVAPGIDPVAIVRDTYAGRPLVRLRAGSPELRHVRGTAFADLSVTASDGMAVVLVAIDNLGRGAAAQAVQCANLAFGLPEQTGLMNPACTP